MWRLDGVCMATPAILPDGCRTTPSVLVPALPCDQPTIGRLYTVAEPLPMPAHGESGVEWEPENCEQPTAHRYCNRCGTSGDAKTFDLPPDLRSASPFSLYGSFACSGPGWTPEEMQRRARQNLINGEEWMVEAELSKSLQTPVTIDLTPAGGAPSFLAGLVALETFARKQFVCVPTIHLRGGLALAAPLGSLVYRGANISTALGSDVTASAGWDTRGPDGTPPPDGEEWLWVTGPVRVWRGEIFEPTAEAASQVDRANNDRSALSERMMLIGHECGAAAIRVTIP